MKAIRSTVLALLALLLTQGASMAQCAMCRGTVENNVAVGDTSVGAGLNTGILYLFFMPYLLFMIIGIFWYRASKRNAARKEQIRSALQR